MAEKLTPQQHMAVCDRGGKLLVSAAAGSGKTKVLVDTGDEILELINPEMMETSGEQTGLEGCLSVPGKNGIVTKQQTPPFPFLAPRHLRLLIGKQTVGCHQRRSGRKILHTSGQGILAHHIFTASLQRKQV